MPQSVLSSAPSRLLFGSWYRPLPAVLLIVALVAAAVPAAADPPPPASAPVLAVPGPTKPGYSRLVDTSAVLQPALAGGDGPRAVFVQLTAVGAAQIWSETLAHDGSPAAAAAAVGRQRQAVRALAGRVTTAAPGAAVLFTVTDAVPGVGLLATPAGLRVLAGRPGVAKISAIVPKVPAGDGSAGSVDPLAGWPGDGLTGAGVRLGIIDTGVDYTHADFGGPGTTAAYAAARSTGASGWRPGNRVVGGFDFVGDSYHAAPASAIGTDAAYQPIPHPDPNPMDCTGHGTRVAGTVAGSGVTAGRTFAGAYAGLTAGAAQAMEVAPGIAPQASIYAFKVFGCAGATDAVIPALDRALDPNQDGDLRDRLDVVDLSLTSSAAAPDDPESAVLDALARFGVLPVVAAGRADDLGAAGSLRGSVRALTIAAAQPVASTTTDALTTPGALPSVAVPPGTAAVPGSPGADLTVAPGRAGVPLAGSGAGPSGAGPADATAVAAGVAALVRQARPGWTPEQIKAALINTALINTAPINTALIDPAPADTAGSTVGGPGGSAVAGSAGSAAAGSTVAGSTVAGSTVAGSGATATGPDGPPRDGATAAGSAVAVDPALAVDQGAAVAAQVLAYSSTEPGAVSVAFGVVPAEVGPEQVIATAAVVVQNTGRSVSSLQIDYRSAAGQSGVTYLVSPATMVLPPGASALATVTMTIVPGALRRTPADGRSPQQRNPLTGLDEHRQYTAATRGEVLLTSAQGTLRVPVTGAARPVSNTSAVDGAVAGDPALVLTGNGFSLSTPGDPASATQQSLLSVLELGYRSPEVPTCRAVAATAATTACSAAGPQADLQAVGAGRTPAVGEDAGHLWFGLATYRDMTAIGTAVLPTVDIDVNGDNTADYTVQVQAVAGTDLLYAMLFDDSTVVSTLVGIYPVNFNLGNVDTDATDSNVLLIPVDPTALGYRPGQPSFPIRYSVTLYSAGGAAENGLAADVTPAVAFDVAAPGLTTTEPLWRDQGGTGVPYRLAPGSAGTDALVLHLHGPAGQRSQVLALTG